MKCNVMGHTWVTEDEIYPAFANCADPDQLASEEAN